MFMFVGVVLNCVVVFVFVSNLELMFILALGLFVVVLDDVVVVWVDVVDDDNDDEVAFEFVLTALLLFLTTTI